MLKAARFSRFFHFLILSISSASFPRPDALPRIFPPQTQNFLLQIFFAKL